MNSSPLSESMTQMLITGWPSLSTGILFPVPLRILKSGGIQTCGFGAPHLPNLTRVQFWHFGVGPNPWVQILQVLKSVGPESMAHLYFHFQTHFQQLPCLLTIPVVSNGNCFKGDSGCRFYLQSSFLTMGEILAWAFLHCSFRWSILPPYSAARDQDCTVYLPFSKWTENI